VLADLGRCSEAAVDIDSALQLTTHTEARLSLQQRLDELQGIAAAAGAMGVPLQA
jgi:predicted RNA polymerase sigma factor